MSVQTLSRRPFAGGGVALLAALFLTPVVFSGPARAADVAVKIDNFTFSPASLTIVPGTTVTFTNNDDIPHTIVILAAKARSKPLDTGDSFSFTFTAAGNFEYFCGLHPHMKGMINVTP